MQIQAILDKPTRYCSSCTLDTASSSPNVHPLSYIGFWAFRKSRCCAHIEICIFCRSLLAWNQYLTTAFLPNHIVIMASCVLAFLSQLGNSEIQPLPKRYLPRLQSIWCWRLWRPNLIHRWSGFSFRCRASRLRSSWFAPAVALTACLFQVGCRSFLQPLDPVNCFSVG